MASKKNTQIKLWDNITDDDFRNEENIDEAEISSYDLEKMKLFSANINYFRQIFRLSDSLKPVERRVLYAMYLSGARPNTKTQKSNTVVGNVMKYHAHGDVSIYSTMVTMAQPWKKACPLIYGKGNFGNDAFPEDYAHSRYTEVLVSKYAWECFFEDYDSECVEVLFNSSADAYEPMSLPSKFPNILVNGGTGIAIGNSFCVPPYNINDIITVTKRLINDPECTNVYMIPDLPSECDIVDNGTCFKEICDTGKGSLRMRAKTNIIDNGKTWVIQILSVPWLSSLKSISDKITALTKAGAIPIKDLHDESYPIKDDRGVRTKIDLRIVIDKSHDPYKIRDKLFSITDLEKTLPVRFKVVLDNLTLASLNLKDLILEWIDVRREYKRRLLNKKISRDMARIALLEVLIYLLKEENIEKTVKTIKNSNDDNLITNLRKIIEVSSYQATKIGDMKLSAFTIDARNRYIAEKDKLEKELKELIDLVRSEAKIDKIIIEELEDLRKYAFPRRSAVIAESSGIEVADTDHMLVFTKQDYIKKLPYNKNAPNKVPVFGAFKNLDYPVSRMMVNNLDNIVLFDSLGKCTRLPVHEIPSTENSSVGTIGYDVTKLNGHVISVFPDFNPNTEEYIKKNLNTNIYLVTLTKKGFMKKTSLAELMEQKTTKNTVVMKLRKDDELIYAQLIMDISNLLIYTKKGQFSFLPATEISLLGKNTMGLQYMKFEDDTDECAGVAVVGDSDTHVLVITKKGGAKRCELANIRIGKRGSGSYLANVDPNDEIQFVDSVNDDSIITVCTRQEYIKYEATEIAELTRRAKCPKKIPIPNGSNIISVGVEG